MIWMNQSAFLCDYKWLIGTDKPARVEESVA